MKRICIISPEGFPVPATKGGAIETLIGNIIDENEKNKKIEIICVARYEKQAKKLSEKYKHTKMLYFRLPKEKSLVDKILNLIYRVLKKITKKNWKNIIHSMRIYNKIKKYDIDYIVVEGGDPMCYEKLLSKYSKNKCILHMHGGEMVGTVELERVYQRFIALNNYMKENFSKNGIINKNRIDIIYNGIDLKQFFNELTLKEKNDLREKYGIKKDDIVLLFCGRLIQAKGVKELILALKQIENIEKVKLLIIGNSAFGKNEKTKYEEELYEISKSLVDKIIFTGFIHNKELYKIHNIADIAITPSIWEDASPLVIVEEMASALPIITTNSGGIPELVGNTAIIVKRDEKIVKNIAENIDLLIKDNVKREKMGLDGRKRSMQFSIENFYENFVKYFDEVENEV